MEMLTNDVVSFEQLGPGPEVQVLSIYISANAAQPDIEFTIL